MLHQQGVTNHNQKSYNPRVRNFSKISRTNSKFYMLEEWHAANFNTKDPQLLGATVTKFSCTGSVHPWCNSAVASCGQTVQQADTMLSWISVTRVYKNDTCTTHIMFMIHCRTRYLQGILLFCMFEVLNFYACDLIFIIRGCQTCLSTWTALIFQQIWTLL